MPPTRAYVCGEASTSRLVMSPSLFPLPPRFLAQFVTQASDSTRWFLVQFCGREIDHHLTVCVELDGLLLQLFPLLIIDPQPVGPCLEALEAEDSVLAVRQIADELTAVGIKERGAKRLARLRGADREGEVAHVEVEV